MSMSPVNLPSSSGGSAKPQASLSGLELRIPPLPQTLMEALDLIDQPEKMEVGPVTEMVQRDPIVVARLLHTVNSAYYGLRHTISSAERAVVMLGPVAVAGIVLGMHMLKLRTILDGPASGIFHKLIRHSIATAFLNRHQLEGPPGTRRRAGGKMGVAFTAGLLHDFGKIILTYNRPDEAVGLYEAGTYAHIEAEDERELERLVFGCDHAEAGEFAARKLNFPDVLTDLIRLQHQTDQTSPDPETNRLLRILRASNMAAKAMGHAVSAELTWDEAAADPLWNTIAENDLPQYADGAALIADLQDQQEHLDQYITNLTAGTESLDLDKAQLPLKQRFWQHS